MAAAATSAGFSSGLSAGFSVDLPAFLFGRSAKNLSSSKFRPSGEGWGGGVARTIWSRCGSMPPRPIQTPEKKAASRQARRMTKATTT